MHGKRSKFVQGFQIFFQREDDKDTTIGKYTFESSLFREIMSYCIKNKDEKFKSRKLSSDWLLECDTYREYYTYNNPKTKNSVKIDNIDKTVKGYLDQLLELAILSRYNTSSKNKEKTVEYKFTNFGILISLLLELEEGNRKNNLSERQLLDNVLKIFNDELKESKTSIDKFCNIVYSKFYDKGMSKVITNHFIDVLKNKGISNKIQFFQHSLNVQATKDNQEEIYNIYQESLDEFEMVDENKYKIFLFNLKQHVERLQEHKSHATKEFEEFKYTFRALENMITVEGYCDKCKKYSAAVVPVQVFLRNYYSINKSHNRCECNEGLLDFEIIN